MLEQLSQSRGESISVTATEVREIFSDTGAVGDTMNEEQFQNWMTLYFKKLDQARFVDTMRRMVELNEQQVGSTLFDPEGEHQPGMLILRG